MARTSQLLRLLLAALVILAACDGCGGCGDDDEGTDAGKEAQDAAAIPEFDAGSIHTVELTPEVLLPVIQAIGFPNVVPSRVTVQFARNLIEGGPRAVADDITLFEITPEIPGRLRFSSQSTLEFKPENGFKPGEEYQITLSQVESRKGSMIPPTPWTHSFKVPEFKFLELSGAYLSEAAKQVQVEMRFSAPIDPKRLPEFAIWKYNGQRVRSIEYSRGNESHVARVILKSPLFERGGTLTVDVEDGFPFDEEVKAPGGTSSVELETGKPVSLLEALRREGPDGYYIEVVCNDESAPGGTRYYYDRRTYDSWRVSRRCLPLDDAKNQISFNPPVNFRIASGEGGFNILGDFKRGNYAMNIESGLRTIDGGVVRSPFTSEVTIPSRSPNITFVNKGRYVPKSQWQKLPIRHLNVDEVEVSVRHVPERNAIFWMSSDSESADHRTSVLIAKKRVKFSSKSDEFNTSFIDVKKLVGEPEPGLYEVTVEGLGEQDSIRLVPTDINLVMKRSATRPGEKWSDSALVWAIDMKTLKPVSGVKVDVVRPSGDVMTTCDTDSTGGCRVSIPTDTVDETPPFALVARKGGEFTYLEYADVKTEAPDAAVQGNAYLSEAAYHAAIWSDRGVYRPGETAHLVAVLRNDDYFAPKGGVPVEVELRDPRQKVLTRKVLKSNDAGVITLDQRFADFAATGFHTMELSIAKKKVASYRFNVEEFVPERMKVSASTATKDYAAGEQVLVDVAAEYLFGGSAEGSTVELTCRIVPTEFEPEENAEYHYGLASDEPKAQDLPAVEAEIAADGTAHLSCPALAETAKYERAAELEATAAVFEAGSGRTTTAMAKANLHPAPYYIGLKSGTEKAAKGKNVKVEGIVVDWAGKPYKGLNSIDVEFIRLEREYWWYWDEDSGESNYGRNIRPAVEAKTTVKVGKNGRFTINGKPGDDAQAWVVAVSAGGTRTELKFEGERRYYYWDDDENSRADITPRPTRPTSISVKGPKTIKVGEAASFEFSAPFDGRMLITTETHEVLTHEWVDVKAGKHAWKFTLADFTPNVYVSALLVKNPHLDSKELFTPDRAYGVKSFRVEPSDKLHTVKLDAPNEVQPNSPLEVKIDIGPQAGPTYATIAAVDEGILSLTRFKTPDPSKELFARRALGVETFETIGWALQTAPGGPSSRTGGGWDEDGEFGDGKGRVMPVKPVALWSGLVEIPKSGKATVKFDVPRYRGALRVMAVTADTTKTGTAETRVFVREPLVLQTTLPRFLSGGDEIQIPVFVTNMSGTAQDVVVTLETEEVATAGLVTNSEGNIVQLRGARTKTLQLDDRKSGTAVFAVRGMRQAGTAKFKVTAKGTTYTAYDEGIVPFRPNGPHERRTSIVELNEGTTSLASVLDGWVPTSERSNIWVTAVPYGEAFSHLRYLIRYPYGCIEQTTSSTRPLLYVQALVGQLDPELLTKNGGIDAMVKHGIERVLSMQTASGGFAYWPGGTRPDSWGTAYATHMLLDAKEAGFDVPQDRLDEVIKWIDDTVKKRSSGDYGYRYGEPYLHYVLARAGKGQKARIQKLIDQVTAKKKISNRDKEQEYLLKTALYLAGDRRYEKELRKPDISPIKRERETRWSYYSDSRRRGFMLSLFHDMFKSDKSGEKLARIVANRLSENKNSRYYTTQEIMWGVTGLGKWTLDRSKKFGDAKLVLGGKRPKPSYVSKDRDDRSWEIFRASEYDAPKVELKGKKGKVFAVVSSQGVRTDGEARIGGNGMTIERTYFDREGAEVEPTGLQLGDLVYTMIEVSNTTNEDLYNMALVDRLPAGWEIENPRLGRGTLPEDLVDEDELWQPEYMALRDDRIEVFGTLKKGESVKLLYAVRAVSAGEFSAPPPEIEGMYDPEKWARSEPVKVKVRGPWDALID